VRVFVDQVFELDEVHQAHTVLEGGHAKGKIVLKVADG
jgi:NADPH:quinone reductase-like Zn-dependent oxidoreductase